MRLPAVKVGWIACLIGGQRFVHKRIDFDPEFSNKIETGVIEFWKTNFLKTDSDFKFLHQSIPLIHPLKMLFVLQIQNRYELRHRKIS